MKNSALESTLKALRSGQTEPTEPEATVIEEAPRQAPVQQAKQIKAQKSARVVVPLKMEPTGAKSTNPEFMQLKVYVRKATKTAAARKWEDQGGKNVSDLIESLLAKYLSS